MTASFRTLADDVHAVRVGDDLVILDVRRDAYHCLPDVDAGRAMRLVGRSITDLEDDIAGQLINAGLLRSEPGLGGENVQFALGPAFSDLSAPAHVRASLAERLQMIAAVVAMARHFHGRPLSYLVARARRRYATVELPLRSPGAAERRRVEVFRRLLPWAPGQGACLYRCVLLLTFLRQAGLDAHWVFGVRTWPFSAHCWLQAGEVVFDDPADYVARFTPMMVI
jgi:hypothetical protein